MRPPALLFGVPIDDLTMVETLDLIEALIRDGRNSGRTHQIATVNVDFLVNALADPAVRGMLQHADVNLADGKPVVWGARMAGMPLRERVAGADLVPELATRAATAGMRVHLFGSAAGVAERACALLVGQHPGARITAASGPFVRDVVDMPGSVLDEIAEIDPDVLCVALGNPKQERFIQAHRERLGTPVMIGIGGSLDMLVGDRRRAPKWAQNTGFEWVFRALQEPGRLGRRYAHDGVVFGPSLARYVRLARRYRNGATVRVSALHDCVMIDSDVGHTQDPTGWGGAADQLQAGKPLRIDLNVTDPLNVRSIAEVTGLVRVARRSGGSVSTTISGAAAVESIEAFGVLELIQGDA